MRHYMEPKKQPIQVDGLDVYSTLYIHRQKSNKHVTSRVVIPVAKGISFPAAPHT